jgi:riboflavin kinase/FMN adenylyltransferase
MTTIHRLDELPADWGPCVVTIGVFDGVHRGHAQLINRTVDTARRLGLPAVLVTFDPHPALVVGPPRDVATLTSIPHRADLAAGLGIDAVCVLSFTGEFAQLTPSEFVDSVLAGALRAATVVVGANFTFGHRGSGTTTTLTQLCEARGISTDAVGLLHHVDATCSSTSIRAALRRGNVRRATAALGRPHRIDTTVTARPNGDQTIQPLAGSSIPAPGRYFARIDGSVPGVVQLDNHGHIQLCHPSAATGPTSIEFIDRLDHPHSQPWK